MQEVAKPPYAQLWLRYSAFIPLYPLGVASELTMAYLALPIIKAKQPLSVHLPNAFNFGFDYYTLCWLIIASYLPGLPLLHPIGLQEVFIPACKLHVILVWGILEGEHFISCLYVLTIFKVTIWVAT